MEAATTIVHQHSDEESAGEQDESRDWFYQDTKPLRSYAELCVFLGLRPPCGLHLWQCDTCECMLYGFHSRWWHRFEDSRDLCESCYESAEDRDGYEFLDQENWRVLSATLGQFGKFWHVGPVDPDERVIPEEYGQYDSELNAHWLHMMYAVVTDYHLPSTGRPECNPGPLRGLLMVEAPEDIRARAPTACPVAFVQCMRNVPQCGRLYVCLQNNRSFVEYPPNEEDYQDAEASDDDNDDDGDDDDNGGRRAVGDLE